MSQQTLAVANIQKELATYEPKVFNRSSKFYDAYEGYYFSYTQIEIESLFVGSNFLITLKNAVVMARQGGLLAETKNIGFKDDIVYLSMQLVYAFFINDSISTTATRKEAHDKRYTTMIYAFKMFLKDKSVSIEKYEELKHEYNHVLYDLNAKLASQRESYEARIQELAQKVVELDEKLLNEKNKSFGKLAKVVQNNASKVVNVGGIYDKAMVEDISFVEVVEHKKQSVQITVPTIPQEPIKYLYIPEPLKDTPICFYHFTRLIFEQYGKPGIPYTTNAIKYASKNFGLYQDTTGNFAPFACYGKAFYYFENKTFKEPKGVMCVMDEESSRGAGMAYMFKEAIEDICNAIGLKPVYVDTSCQQATMSTAFWIYLHGMGIIKQQGEGFVFTKNLEMICPHAFDLRTLKIVSLPIKAGVYFTPNPKNIEFVGDVHISIKAFFENLAHATTISVK